MLAHGPVIQPCSLGLWLALFIWPCLPPLELQPCSFFRPSQAIVFPWSLVLTSLQNCPRSHCSSGNSRLLWPHFQSFPVNETHFLISSRAQLSSSPSSLLAFSSSQRPWYQSRSLSLGLARLSCWPWLTRQRSTEQFVVTLIFLESWGCLQLQITVTFFFSQPLLSFMGIVSSIPLHPLWDAFQKTSSLYTRQLTWRSLNLFIFAFKLGLNIPQDSQPKWLPNGTLYPNIIQGLYKYCEPCFICSSFPFSLL